MFLLITEENFIQSNNNNKRTGNNSIREHIFAVEHIYLCSGLNVIEPKGNDIVMAVIVVGLVQI